MDMRGIDHQQADMYSYISPETRVRADHPLPVWDATVFTKNRDRLLEGDVAREFLSEVVKQAQAKGLTSDEHFTVDGTLIEAWAGLKSFQRKDEKNEPPDDPGNPT